MIKPSEALTRSFNEQIGHEMFSSMQYIAVASYFEDETLPELASFFFRQSEEERTHAMKFVRFLLDVEAKVEIPAIQAPTNRFSSAQEAVALALASERKISELIFQLVESAREEGNLPAQRFLDWFVTEQQEEEATMSSLLAVVERAGESGLLHVEDYLARQKGSLGGAE